MSENIGDSNCKAVGEDIPVSNSFKELSVNSQNQQLPASSKKSGSDKENRHAVNVNLNEKLAVQASTVSFSALSEKKGPGMGDDGQGRKKTTNKMGLKNVIGTKSTKGNISTRGLVFGPTRGKIDRVANGKRMRGDHEEGCRPGGVFVAGGVEKSTLGSGSGSTMSLQNPAEQGKKMSSSEIIPTYDKQVPGNSLVMDQ